MRNALWKLAEEQHEFSARTKIKESQMLRWFHTCVKWSIVDCLDESIQPSFFFFINQRFWVCPDLERSACLWALFWGSLVLALEFHAEKEIVYSIACMSIDQARLAIFSFAPLFYVHIFFLLLRSSLSLRFRFVAIRITELCDERKRNFFSDYVQMSCKKLVSHNADFLLSVSTPFFCFYTFFFTFYMNSPILQQIL